MQNYTDINSLFNSNDKARIILYVENKEIDWIEVNSKGRITNTGEKIKRIEFDKNNKKIIRFEDGDTFQDTYIDLKSICVGCYPKVTFNKKIFTELNYKINAIERA